jgi:hypothetical protein
VRGAARSSARQYGPGSIESLAAGRTSARFAELRLSELPQKLPPVRRPARLDGLEPRVRSRAAGPLVTRAGRGACADLQKIAPHMSKRTVAAACFRAVAELRPVDLNAQNLSLGRPLPLGHRCDCIWGSGPRRCIGSRGLCTSVLELQDIGIICQSWSSEPVLALSEPTTCLHAT